MTRAFQICALGVLTFAVAPASVITYNGNDYTRGQDITFQANPGTGLQQDSGFAGVLTVLVDGNPLVDVSATERISSVIFRGERVDRQDLFDQK